MWPQSGLPIVQDPMVMMMMKMMVMMIVMMTMLMMLMIVMLSKGAHGQDDWERSGQTGRRGLGGQNSNEWPRKRFCECMAMRVLCNDDDDNDHYVDDGGDDDDCGDNDDENDADNVVLPLSRVHKIPQALTRHRIFSRPPKTSPLV